MSEKLLRLSFNLRRLVESGLGPYDRLAPHATVKLPGGLELDVDQGDGFVSVAVAAPGGMSLDSIVGVPGAGDEISVGYRPAAVDGPTGDEAVDKFLNSQAGLAMLSKAPTVGWRYRLYNAPVRMFILPDRVVVR